eukprot:contig_19660_g4833
MHAHKAASTASARPGQDVSVPPISAPVSSSGIRSRLELAAGALTVAATVSLGLLTLNISQYSSSTHSQLDKMEASTRSQMDRMEASTCSQMDKMEASMENKIDKMEKNIGSQLVKMNVRTCLQNLRARMHSDSFPGASSGLLFALRSTNLDKLKTEEDVLRLELHLMTMQKFRGKDFDAVEEVRAWLDCMGS